MRLIDSHRLCYLYQKRLVLIQKAYNPLYLRIQRIGNRAIDDWLIDSFDDKETVHNPSFKQSTLEKWLMSANLPVVRKELLRLLNNKLVTPSHIAKMEAYVSANRISGVLTRAELERIEKNLKWVEKTVEEAEFNIKTYKTLIDELPTQVSRKDILKRALESGENYKGREYSYQELQRVSRSLDKYRLHASDYHTGLLENREADRQRLDMPNQIKIWHYDPNELTRHEGMDNTVVDFASKFEVINDKTGDTDWFRFPGDIENDTNNCSNICNCKCFFTIS